MKIRTGELAELCETAIARPTNAQGKPACQQTMSPGHRGNAALDRASKLNWVVLRRQLHKRLHHRHHISGPVINLPHQQLLAVFSCALTPEVAKNRRDYDGPSLGRQHASHGYGDREPFAALCDANGFLIADYLT